VAVCPSGSRHGARRTGGTSGQSQERCRGSTPRQASRSRITASCDRAGSPPADSRPTDRVSARRGHGRTRRLPAPGAGAPGALDPDDPTGGGAARDGRQKNFPAQSVCQKGTTPEVAILKVEARRATRGDTSDEPRLTGDRPRDERAVPNQGGGRRDAAGDARSPRQVAPACGAGEKP